MDWDDENPVVPTSVPSSVPTTDEVAGPAEPMNTVTVTKTQWRLAKSLSALVLILVIGGGGFILGHDVVTPRPIRVSAPNYTFPTFPSGNGGSFQFPSVTPPNTKADKAAAKIAKKGESGLVD